MIPVGLVKTKFHVGESHAKVSFIITYIICHRINDNCSLLNFLCWAARVFLFCLLFSELFVGISLFILCPFFYVPANNINDPSLLIMCICINMIKYYGHLNALIIFYLANREFEHESPYNHVCVCMYVSGNWILHSYRDEYDCQSNAFFFNECLSFLLIVCILILESLRGLGLLIVVIGNISLTLYFTVLYHAQLHLSTAVSLRQEVYSIHWLAAESTLQTQVLVVQHVTGHAFHSEIVRNLLTNYHSDQYIYKQQQVLTYAFTDSSLPSLNLRSWKAEIMHINK